MKRFRLIAVIAALLASVGVVIIVVARFQPETLLRIDIPGLPPNTAARVVVSGPQSTTYTVTATDVRAVPPGHYSLAIHPVRSGAQVYYPTDDVRRVTVVQGRATTARAAYRVVIPDTTTVLQPARDVVQVRGAQVHVRAGSPMAGALAVGRYLISGEGPGVPHMLVRRVEATRRAGDRITVDTAPAASEDALPAGVVRVRQRSLSLMRPVAHTDDPLASVEFSADTKLRACSTKDEASAVSAKITYELKEASFDFTGDGPEVAWKKAFGVPYAPKSVSLAIGAQLTLTHGIEADIEAALTCEMERAIPLGCASLPGEIARIGPISLECEFNIIGKAKAEAKATWHSGKIEAQTRIGFEAGYDSDDGGFHGDADLDNDLVNNPPDIPEHESSFGASLGFEIGLKGKDPIPFGTAEVSLGFRVTAGPEITSSRQEFKGEFKIEPELKAEGKIGAFGQEIKADGTVNLGDRVFTLWRIPRATPIPTPSLSAPVSDPARTPSSSSRPDMPRFFLQEWGTGGGNCCYGIIRRNYTGQFGTRAGAGTARDVYVVLWPAGENLAGRVTRATRERARGLHARTEEISSLQGAPVRVERTGRHTIKVFVDGELFSSLCDIPIDDGRPPTCVWR
ncbi:hypothetical protein ACFWYW_56965 [Nonomuraea sp. NPDC059023]|uniref:hypothetical protein n=1 Tax=unclassified Nonomuraea TaxID=2593643 RepID=UPI0036C65A52